MGNVTRILVSDDFAPFREWVAATLKDQPNWLIIGEASDGAETIQKAQKLRPDLILLDLNMPKLTGVQAAKEIIATIPETKILVLSQHNDPDVVDAALSEGVRGFVLKSCANSELVPAIQAILRGEKFVSRRSP